MTSKLLGLGSCLSMLMALAACQQQASKANAERIELEPTITPVSASAQGPNWRLAEDCQGKLALLKRGLDEGWISDLEGTPFKLIEYMLASDHHPWPTGSGAIDAGTSSFEARCILRIGRATDQQSEHRILGKEQVRSRYQSGTRSEKNPAYEVAKAKLRQAEAAAKPGKSSLIKVGDPLIDLVGTLVGGALTGIGQWGKGDQVEDALDALMATPSSIDRPIYKSYAFERTYIRARRDAVLSVILTDRQLQKSWEARLRQRETQDLKLVEGLDRQDEDYARYHAESVTESGLQQWLAEPPIPPLKGLVAGLHDQLRAAPFDRLALNSADERGLGGDPLMDRMSLDAALPIKGSTHNREPKLRRQPRPSSGPALQSLVTVLSDLEKVEGVYVTPHFILSPSDTVTGSSLVDVKTRSGETALGLVAAVDQRLGLALIQTSSRGVPIAILGRHETAAFDEPPRSSVTSAAPDSTITSDAVGGALFVDGRFAGFKTRRGPGIGLAAIQSFLDQQRDVLSIDQKPKAWANSR